MRPLAFFLLASLAADAETRTLTLRQAVELALQQNPDLTLAKLNEERAQLGVRAATEPLLPRVTAGSGIAYTYGFPLSIEGSAPSIIEVNATRSLLNLPQRYSMMQAREEAKGATFGTAAAKEEVALRTAVLFLDLERTDRTLEAARRQEEQAKRVEASTRLRVDEGRELSVEARRAALTVARAHQKIRLLEGTRETIARALAAAVGVPLLDRIVAVSEERRTMELPPNEDSSVQQALSTSPELKRLESAVQAKSLEAKGQRASRLPRVDFVAKYGLFADYNNFQDYFQKFQKNNALAGASIHLPLFGDPASEARAQQAEVDIRKLRTEASVARGRIESSARQAWQNVGEAQAGQELARMDLELAREQVSVLLAQMEEGRATLKQVEEARFLENERWITLYDAGFQLERARLELLRQTNTLVAALR